MYAVWRCDSYPFILCGKVLGDPNDEGKVEVAGYHGYLFTPLELISDKRGKEIQNAITQAKRQYDEQCSELQGSIAETWSIDKYLPVRKSTDC